MSENQSSVGAISKASDLPAASKELASVNGYAILMIIVGAAVATIVTDLFGKGSYLALICALGWLISMSVALLLLGRFTTNEVSVEGIGGLIICARYGVDSMKAQNLYAMLLALMAVMALYSAYAKLCLDDGSVLRVVAPTAGLNRNSNTFLNISAVIITPTTNIPVPIAVAGYMPEFQYIGFRPVRSASANMTAQLAHRKSDNPQRQQDAERLKKANRTLDNLLK